MKILIITTVILLDDGGEDEDERPAQPVPNPTPNPLSPNNFLRKLLTDVRKEFSEEPYGTFFKG